MSIAGKIEGLKQELGRGVTLVAVSKTHPSYMIKEAYDTGQRIFGESRPQEMTAKYNELPKDIEWHFIGGLQTNKVKYIAPYVSLIHSVDSARLLEVINKEAFKNGRMIDVLFEMHIAREESKQGWSEVEICEYLSSGALRDLGNIRPRGVMGMATYIDDTDIVREEFTGLYRLYERVKKDYFSGAGQFDTVSMGMTGDYKVAVECGSNMVRIGSYIFGGR